MHCLTAQQEATSLITACCAFALGQVLSVLPGFVIRVVVGPGDCLNCIGEITQARLLASKQGLQ
jgi:hypothetical protein